MNKLPCAPLCNCGLESVFVDNGPRLQYYYCRTCKTEVELQSAPAKILHINMIGGAGVGSSNGMMGLSQIVGSPAKQPYPDYLVLAVDFNSGFCILRESPTPDLAEYEVTFMDLYAAGFGAPNIGDMLYGLPISRAKMRMIVPPIAPMIVPSSGPPSGSTVAATSPQPHRWGPSPAHMAATCMDCGLTESDVARGHASHICYGAVHNPNLKLLPSQGLGGQQKSSPFLVSTPVQVSSVLNGMFKDMYQDVVDKIALQLVEADETECYFCGDICCDECESDDYTDVQLAAIKMKEWD